MCVYIVLGPPDTPYAGSYFTLKIQVPKTYPLSPPKVVFVTRVWSVGITLALSLTLSLCSASRSSGIGGGGQKRFSLRVLTLSSVHVPVFCFFFFLSFFSSHPNVHFKSGEICLDVLKDAWTPIWTLESTCRAVIALLGTPDATSPLNCDISNLYRAGDTEGANNLIQMYTIDFATKNMPPIQTESKRM